MACQHNHNGPCTTEMCGHTHVSGGQNAARFRAVNATRAVTRNLAKDHPDYGLWEVWQRLPYGSLEAFRASAEAWLKDRSELASKTLGDADWEEVYRTFKEMHDSD